MTVARGAPSSVARRALPGAVVNAVGVAAAAVLQNEGLQEETVLVQVTSSRRPSIPPKSGGVGGLPCGIAAAAAAAAGIMKATHVAAPMPVSTVVHGGLSPAAEAELFHVRNMIQTLQSSLAAFQKAEQEILSRAAGR
mmetsp:Transcript_21606/g.57052  ORF Transcript_21606/g.57052 Transcript_21606/m.57052 type:complete len:138 (-) Transcript_21606:188-601(-)